MICCLCGDMGEIFDEKLKIKRICECKKGHPVSIDRGIAALYAITPESLGGAQEVMDAVTHENN